MKTSHCSLPPMDLLNKQNAGKSLRTKSSQSEGSQEFSHYYGLHSLSFTPIPNSDILYSEESERVSELKNVTGTGKLPYGTLALGSEGIKEAITSFEDAYVIISGFVTLVFTYLYLPGGSRISKTSAFLQSLLTLRMLPLTFLALPRLMTNRSQFPHQME